MLINKEHLPKLKLVTTIPIHKQSNGEYKWHPVEARAKLKALGYWKWQTLRIIQEETEVIENGKKWFVAKDYMNVYIFPFTREKGYPKPTPVRTFKGKSFVRKKKV